MQVCVKQKRGNFCTDKGKWEGLVQTRSLLEETGSSKYSGFSLAELFQSLISCPTVIQTELSRPSVESGKLVTSYQRCSLSLPVKSVLSLSGKCMRAPCSGLPTPF